MSSNQPQSDDRIEQIEESLGYLEIDNTRAREQFDVLSKAVHELSGRMERLESRLMDLNSRLDQAESDPGVVAPPHSAGPDISRDPL
ncbi:MAG: hypothetical protein ACSHX5_04480 [Phycisphaerales bacterium]